MPSSNGNRRCRRLVLPDFFLVILCVWLCLIFFQLCLISSWWSFVSSYAFMVVLCFQLCPKITCILTVTVSCTHTVSLYMLRISRPYLPVVPYIFLVVLRFKLCLHGGPLFPIVPQDHLHINCHSLLYSYCITLYVKNITAIKNFFNWPNHALSLH